MKIRKHDFLLVKVETLLIEHRVETLVAQRVF